MKAVALCVLVLCAFVASAQDLQYEQAAYADNAAPAPLDQMPAEQQVEADVAQDEDQTEESSFAEVQDESIPGALSKAAHKVGQAISKVKQLFASRKNKGGNVSPSRPASAPRPGKLAAKRKAAIKAAKKAVKRAAKKAAKKAARNAIKANPMLKGLKPRKLSKPIIDRKKKSKGGRGSGGRGRGGRGRGRGGRGRGRGGRGRRPLRIPRPPPSADGPVDRIWHSERFIPKDSPNRDPEMAKLNLALEAVKEDILSTNKQINDERRWVIAVSKIIKSYTTKMQRVEQHIIALRKEMKQLYRKKKQIENLKLQKALEAKLKEAKAELVTLTNSLKHVAVKQGELNKSGRDLRLTIAGIQGQLAKLRGQQMFKKCKKGTKYSRKAKKCVSICKKGKVFSKKAKKCISRCKKGQKWNKKTRKCSKAKKGKGKGKGKARKARK
jgi:hypothetical protein